MKKLALIVMLLANMFIGLQAQAPELRVREPERYEADCRYDTNGCLVTTSGEVFIYHTDKVSGKAVYDGMPVWACFDDNGTDQLEDDVVIGLVYDRETAMFDAFEKSFSEVDDWNITREGNNIHISLKED